MWTALVLLAVLGGLGAAGITGRGAVDTRDPAFTARTSAATPVREDARR